ncbi:response regulator [bacterium]|nr:response regulator [bacterium]MBU1651509.1 response regulator [bacterium]
MSEQKTILIIDDEPDTQTYFASVLEDNGYKVIIAGDGRDGLAKIKESMPSLITLDISMPEKSGVGLYRELRASEAFAKIPVIIITGVSDDFRQFISTRSQVPPPEGYLSKPIDPDELLSLVSQLTA